MKYLFITTTLIPFIAAFALTSAMQDTLVHGLDQDHSVIRSRNLKSGKTPKSPKTASASKSRRALKASKVPKSHGSANRVMTMWWVIFNKPSECTGGSTNPEEPSCGISDVMNTNKEGLNIPQISIINASGGIPNENGFLRMAAVIYETQCALDLDSSSDNGHYLWGGPPVISQGIKYGLCPATGEQSELHIVIRDHGPPTDDVLWQMTRFTDPSCAVEGEPGNLCADSGVVAFPASNDDEVVTLSVVGFPKYPVGCFEDEKCTELEEAIQLRSGSKVTLIQTGSGYQAIAEINAPRV